MRCAVLAGTLRAELMKSSCNVWKNSSVRFSGDEVRWCLITQIMILFWGDHLNGKLMKCRTSDTTVLCAAGEIKGEELSSSPTNYGEQWGPSGGLVSFVSLTKISDEPLDRITGNWNSQEVIPGHTAPNVKFLASTWFNMAATASWSKKTQIWA